MKSEYKSASRETKVKHSSKMFYKNFIYEGLPETEIFRSNCILHHSYFRCSKIKDLIVDLLYHLVLPCLNPDSDDDFTRNALRAGLPEINGTSLNNGLNSSLVEYGVSCIFIYVQHVSFANHGLETGLRV
jgi:hypothetical protein